MAAMATASRRRLDQATIVRAALAVIDREGLDALTMRRLGAELRADPTAVYRHFRDKEELLNAVADAILSAAADAFRPSTDWRRTLRDLCQLAWDMYHAHPRFAGRLSRSPEVLEGHERLTEVALGALRAAGLSDADAAMCDHLLVNYTAGVASVAAELHGIAPAAEAWRRAYAMLPADRYPNCVALASHMFSDPKEQFDFGVEMLLDGIEGMAGAGVSTRLSRSKSDS
jgi:TetR/AcrR family transcriptional regulator, tetracycline repressor protein